MPDLGGLQKLIRMKKLLLIISIFLFSLVGFSQLIDSPVSSTVVDSNLVHKTGVENVYGVKTFTSNQIFSAGLSVTGGNLSVLGSISRGGTVVGTGDNLVNLGDVTSSIGSLFGGSYVSILGGIGNNNEGYASAIVSGVDNHIGSDADHAFIGSGKDNTIFSGAGGFPSYTTIGGGQDNTVSREGATVVGGKNNTVSGLVSTAAGFYNTVSGDYSFAAGIYNVIAGNYATALGGYNTASANGSVAIGHYNTAAGDYSFAGGRNMRLSAAADRSFVWGYHTSAVSITTPDVALFYPEGTLGSVGIGTKAPLAKLTVDGNKSTLNLLEVINNDAGIVGDSTFYITKLGGGSFTGNLIVDGNIYGTMGFADSTVVLPCTQNVYCKIDNGYAAGIYTTGVNSNLTFAGDSIQVPSTLDYKITWDLSYSGTNTDDYHIEIFINNVGQAGKGETHRDMTTSNVGHSGSSTILSLTANDWISLRIKNTQNANDPTVVAGNVLIEQKF